MICIQFKYIFYLIENIFSERNFYTHSPFPPHLVRVAGGGIIQEIMRSSDFNNFSI